ncbi:hypothetical protein [Flavilitoribacter nigricans]|uniref:Uncharacterized protein n=1 Tax=Flavilitoribacter nigricans (strain ATCC 23147 / DSM 23189 / NBRC 102662 / NCIMB 1420 / SS-2) TaxID=1122177 RepID=A0A2D0N9S6_FLAN2|nr:hypothetical protein [Flavilitoribacter nigricans]PHN05271.1 hypothetical protein CRP01_17290 [Flavilitoribacter nigricans DSM 23189 = NBRC 102662]
MRKRAVCQIQLEFPKNTNKQRVAADEQKWACPPNQYIVSYYHHVISDLGPVSCGITEVPANYGFVSDFLLNEAFESAVDVAASLGYQGNQLAEITAQLNASHSNLLQKKSAISTSHGTIIHSASIRGAGFPNGSTIYKGEVQVTLDDIPDALASEAALQQYFQRIVDQYAAGNAVDPAESDMQPYESAMLSNILDLGWPGKFMVNKYNQLIRHYYQDGHKAEVLAPANSVIKGTLRYSEKYQTIFALTEGENESTDILVVSKVNDAWQSGVVKKWGVNIVPESFKANYDDFGVHGVNELGKLVITWEDNIGGTELPNGKKLSYAIINEVNNLI